MDKVSKYYEKLSDYSSTFLAKSKDPSNEYDHPNYGKLRTFISLIITIQTKFKNQLFFSYRELLKTIIDSCPKPAVKYSPYFLFLKIYTPIIQKLQNTIDIDFAFEILEMVLNIVDIQKLSIEIFNILIKNHSKDITTLFINLLEKNYSISMESYCRILMIIGKCEFDMNIDCIENLLNSILPKAKVLLKDPSVNQHYTYGLMCLLNRSVYESSSQIYTKWYDELKPKKISSNDDNKKFKKLILLSLAMHNKHLLKKSTKKFSVIEEGLKFNTLNEPITLLIRAITFNEVKSKTIEDILSHPPKSILTYPNIVCQILEKYINLNKIDETYYFESLAKSDVYECLIYYPNLNKNMKKEMIKKAISQNRYDLLLKIIDKNTFQFAVPAISELIRLQYPYYLILEYCSSNLSIIPDIISSSLLNITKFMNAGLIDSMLCLIIDLLEFIKNFHNNNSGNKTKFLTTVDIHLCNAIAFIYLIAQNSNLRLLAQYYCVLLFDVYCIEFKDWKEHDIFEIPIYHFLNTYPKDKLELIYPSFDEISSSLKDDIFPHNNNETHDIFKLFLSKTKRNIIYQLFLTIYNKSEKFKDVMNKLFSNTSQQYITIKCLKIVSNFSQNNINFIMSLILQSSKIPVIYAVTYTNYENRIKILDFLKKSNLQEYQKIRIVRHILQKINSEPKNTTNSYNDFLIFLFDMNHIFQEFIKTFIITETVEEYLIALLCCLTVYDETFQYKNISEIYEIFVNAIKKLGKIYQNNENNAALGIIFKIFIKLSILMVNSEASFDIRKTFSIIDGILSFVPVHLSISELDPLFLIITKVAALFSECINSIKLTTFTKCYVIGYFSIKYYPLIQTDEHLSFSIALALVVQDVLFLKCPNLIDCLSKIQWTSSTNPSLSRKRSANRTRRNAITIDDGKIPKTNTSRFISGTVLNLTEIFVTKIMNFICEPEISHQLFEKFMSIVLPWLTNIKLTSLSKFQNIFESLFTEKCLKQRRIYAMKVLIPNVQFSTLYFLEELFKNRFTQDYFILTFQCSDSKEKVVEFLESKILIQQKTQFCFHILYNIHFIDEKLVSNPRLLALIYPFMILNHEIMIFLNDIMKLFGDFKSIEMILDKNGKEFKKEFIIYIISLLGYKMNPNISNILLNFSREYAKNYEVEYILKFFSAMGRKDSQLALITHHLLSLYNIVPEESRMKIYEFGKVMIQTDNKEITEAAFKILRDNPQNQKIIFQCLLRGTLTYDQIKPYIDCNNLDKECVYWYRIMEGIEIDESCFPELDDMFCAIKYGSSELIVKIAETIPILIQKGFVISHLLNQMFDIKNIRIKELLPIFNQIPTEMFVLPQNLEKPNLVLKLPIISLEDVDHLGLLKNF